MAERQLNLYSTFAYTEAYFALDAERRSNVRKQVSDGAKALAEATSFYTVYPARSDVDLLIWSTWNIEEGCHTKRAFVAYAKAAEGWRKWIKPVQTLWGYTGVSTYARGKSEQDIDPFEGQRGTYFVVYPFSKTKEWYLMSPDARQGQMNEHIKLGKQYPDIKQLLLYSFGLQDQEFVVAYETEDLPLFGDLVRALRSTEARRHTALDTPIITGVYRTAEEFVSE
jgi:chlorite dismutase